MTRYYNQCSMQQRSWLRLLFVSIVLLLAIATGTSRLCSAERELAGRATLTASAYVSSEPTSLRLQKPAEIARSLASTNGAGNNNNNDNKDKASTSADNQDELQVVQRQHSRTSSNFSTQKPFVAATDPSSEPFDEEQLAQVEPAPVSENRRRNQNRVRYYKPRQQTSPPSHYDGDRRSTDSNDCFDRNDDGDVDDEEYMQNQNFAYTMIAKPMASFASMFNGVLGRLESSANPGYLYDLYDKAPTRGGRVSSMASSSSSSLGDNDDYSEGVSLVSRNGRVSGIRSTTRNGRTRTTRFGDFDNEDEYRRRR